jgi:hypothetical protein
MHRARGLRHELGVPASFQTTLLSTPGSGASKVTNGVTTPALSIFSTTLVFGNDEA